jgi:hypothetical protein
LASTPIETERKRGQLVGNVRSLVDKYCAIFDWDVPDIAQAWPRSARRWTRSKGVWRGDGRRSRTGSRHGLFIRPGLNELAQSAASEKLL